MQLHEAMRLPDHLAGRHERKAGLLEVSGSLCVQARTSHGLLRRYPGNLLVPGSIAGACSGARWHSDYQRLAGDQQQHCTVHSTGSERPVQVSHASSAEHSRLAKLQGALRYSWRTFGRFSWDSEGAMKPLWTDKL